MVTTTTNDIRSTKFGQLNKAGLVVNNDMQVYVVNDLKLLENQDIDLQAQISGLSPNTSASALSAAGTNQATATTISKTNNRIDTVASGTGVKPSVTATANFTQTVQNNGANDLLYYPFLGNSFYIIGSGAMAANLPITIAPGNQVTVFCYDAGVLTLI